MSVLIRPENAGDFEAIRDVLAACFPTEAEGRLVELLREAGHLPVSLVAEVDRGVVGHVAFSPVSAESVSPGVGLAPLAVLEAHRGRGIGSKLVEAGLQACLSEGYGWVVVLGDPEYYSRFGFRPASEKGLLGEYGGGDAFQVLELVAGALPEGGLVRYAPEFASLS